MKKMVSMIRWNVILVLCIGVILMGACADDKQENKVEKSFSNADSNTCVSEQIVMSIWGQPFVFDTTISAYDISCNKLTTEFPIDFVFDIPEEFSVTIDGIEVDNDVYQYQINNIGAIDSSIYIEFKSQERNIVVRLKTLPADYPELSTFGSGSKPGRYYFTAQGYLTKIDEKGNIVFYQKELLKGGLCTDIVDFKQVITESGKNDLFLEEKALIRI